MNNRRWSFEAARSMMSEVRSRTEKAVLEVETLLERRDGLPEQSPERAQADAELRRVVSGWIRSMEALGLEVKGLWLVDFDNGEGYYCWRWPEPRLEHFHGYEEGFGGRVRIH